MTKSFQPILHSTCHFKKKKIMNSSNVMSNECKSFAVVLESMCVGEQGEVQAGVQGG